MRASNGGHPTPAETPVLLIASAAAAATVAGGAVAAGGVAPWERAAFVVLNHRAPDVIGSVVWLPMQFGAGATPLVVATLLWRMGRSRPAAAVAVSGVSAWLAAKAAKQATGRERPGGYLADTRYRPGSADHGLGYPSGHAAVAAAIATTLSPDVGRRMQAALWTATAVVAWSRVYVGAHLPLDVIGGVALGVWLGASYLGGGPLPARVPTASA